MGTFYWNDWYAIWGWVLWVGFVFLLFSSVGNWGYTYRAHRKLGDGYPSKDALTILNERYARGEVKHDDYIKIKSQILPDAKKPEVRVTQSA